MNETINSAIVKRHIPHREKQEIPSWNQICALMDRIRDIVWYFDKMDFHTDDCRMLVFDFYAFMTQASVLDHCILALAKVYDVDLTEENSSCEIFGKPGTNGEGSDQKYFEYIRSLCTVHPDFTSFFKDKYHDEYGESCPYVTINDLPLNDYEGDLIAVVYPNNGDSRNKYVEIKFNQIFAYVRRRYSILDKISDSIVQYDKMVDDEWASIELKKPDDFSDYIDYLRYLREQNNLRFPASEDNEIDLAIRMLTVKISDQENLDCYNKYCNALKYAMGFEHNRIQTMGHGTDSEMGIVDIPHHIGFSKFDLLLRPSSGTEEHNKYHYPLEKLVYLINPYLYGYNPLESDDAWFAASMILAHRDFFGRYVKLYEGMDYLEMYTLVHVNLYFDCLYNDCVINDFIPNEPEFRDVVKRK